MAQITLHPRAAGVPQIKRAELIAQCSRQGEGYRLPDPRIGDDTPVLAGQHQITRLRPGLETHCTDIHDLHDLLIETEVEAGLNLVYLIAGEAQARFDTQQIRLTANGMQGDAMLLALAESAQFSRQSRMGRYERKAAIFMQPQWLDESGFDTGVIAAFRQQHLAMQQWQPSPRAGKLVEQMIAAPILAPALHKLYLESRALELVAEAFTQLQGQAATQPAPQTSVRSFSKLCKLREWLDSGEADELSMQDIARHAGCNAHCLQEQFRATYGTTIFDYLRKRRLQTARNALETQGISVSQAAWLAGYSSPANFATAFKRCFGISPKQVQRA